MFARTERLLLRPGWKEDAPALLAAISDERVVRNLTRVCWPYCLADAEAFLARARSDSDTSMLIFRRTDDAPELIGSIALAAKQDGSVVLSYWITPSCWGQGYATEAGRAVVTMARDSLRLPAIRASHFRDNPASGRVLYKLGFRPTGRIAPRFSAGRRGPALCVDYALPLGEQVAADDLIQSNAACEMLAA